jgi:hypothetical protein
VANAPKVYDFALEKVEAQVVAFLKTRRGSSTVADMIAGTGLPKYQVEQAAKAALDEYAGRLKATESGELLYYFPGGMRSTVHGAGPSLRRFWKRIAGIAARVLSLLFKIWIVAMLVGYFVAFVALIVLAIVASFAASAAGNSSSRGRSRGGGLGGGFLMLRLLDLLLRMWFWTSFFKGADSRKPKDPNGRAFYKSVFGFVFGEGDPNKGWDEAERRHIIAYVRSRKGVITLEELMALCGREPDQANALMNRLLLEFEGEPGVTENGTVIYTFPELMRTSDAAQKASEAAPLANPTARRIIPFSANKKRTNGWIAFFNAFNLGFGLYFLGIGVTQGAAAISRTGPWLFSFTGQLLMRAGIHNPAPLLAFVLGIVPVAFSVLFFLVPLFRRLRLNRQNAKIREEALRRRILAQVLSSPSRVDPRDIKPSRTALDPRNLPAASRRIIERLAAAMHAEPIPQEHEGAFAWRFAELERELADLESHRKGVDLKRYELGSTVFDSGR